MNQIKTLEFIKIKILLFKISHCFTKDQELFFCQQVKQALSNDQNLIEYLQSNDLWGGSGSLADQSGLSVTPTDFKLKTC